jgi:hypothetical protein
MQGRALTAVDSVEPAKGVTSRNHPPSKKEGLGGVGAAGPLSPLQCLIIKILTSFAFALGDFVLCRRIHRDVEADRSAVVQTLSTAYFWNVWGKTGSLIS